MRNRFQILICLLMFIGNAASQQFYRSTGLKLFNQRQYRAAIDSIQTWADAHTAERGIAYYYIGESYYNLGIEQDDRQHSIRLFQSGSDYLRQALEQSDLRSKFTDKLHLARYKVAWCQFRLAELENDPVQSLERAARTFYELSSSSDDTLSMYALYMSGEANLRAATWRRQRFHLTDNPGRQADVGQYVIRKISEAQRHFQRVSGERSVSQFLRTCAQIRRQDALFQKGKLYQKMSSTVFGNIQDEGKSTTAYTTATSIFSSVKYGSVLQYVNFSLKSTFIPVVIYSDAVTRLNSYWITGNDQFRQSMNSLMDSLKVTSLQTEKTFLEACRDQRTPIEDDLFFRLTDRRTSFYARAANAFPEAWYWLGLVQFIVNAEESEDHLQQFLGQTAEESSPRLEVLREDAQYRIFLLQFDKNASDRNVLQILKQDLESFRPKMTYIRQGSASLLQLVRVGLGESVWTRILQASSTEAKLRDAFSLIQNMLIRASQVTGKERVPYLNYLDQLFKITEGRRSQATTFYRGLSAFLNAEIQETAQAKRQLYYAAADQLKQSSGIYQNEGIYVQARSYFAAAKHASKADQIQKVYNKAKPHFVDLINESKSLRSVYYLGEIFRIQGNDLAARKCYEVVIQKTRDQDDGDFWYNNAQAGLQSSNSSGDIAALNGIRIEDVQFPENLLVDDGQIVSLEKFADPDYIRRQYWAEALDILMKYGPYKIELYPSVNILQQSHFADRGFQTITADIQERVGAIASGITIQVAYPPGVPQTAVVSVDGVVLEQDARGFYRKSPISIEQSVKIRVTTAYCYPFAKNHQLTKPGIERLVVSLIRKNHFQEKGFGVEQGVQIVKFPDRLDGNTILESGGSGFTVSSFLYRDFHQDIAFRDFAFSKPLDSYLVLNTRYKNPMIYRNDPMISKEGVFPLSYSSEEDKLKSPEGIAVDAEGKIYIADWEKHRVSVFDKDGTFLQSFGKFGMNEEEDQGREVSLTYPTKIALSQDTEGIPLNDKRIYGQPILFVADRNGVHIIDITGTYWDTIKTTGIQKGAIYGLTVRGYGSGARVYVMDRNTQRVRRFLATPVAIQ